MLKLLSPSKGISSVFQGPGVPTDLACSGAMSDVSELGHVVESSVLHVANGFLGARWSSIEKDTAVRSMAFIGMVWADVAP